MNRTAMLLVASLVLGQPQLVLAAFFNTQDVVVVSIGDGTAANPDPLSVPVSLLSFSPTGVAGNTLLMPTTTNGSNHALTLGNNRAAGGLNLTADGRYLVMGGTDNAPRPALNVSDTRTIGRVDVDGNIDTSTTFNGAYTGTDQIGIRSVASVDGSSYYLAGRGNASNEVRYAVHGSNSTTALVAAGTASRHVAIAEGNLYLAQDGAVNQIGNGLPTGGTSAITALAGVGGPPTGGNWNSPVLFDLNPAVAGVDTLYLGVQRSNNLDLPAIVKFTFNGVSWTQADTFDVAGDKVGMLFLTGRLENGNVVLYGSTDTSGAPSFGNSLVRLVDLGPGSTFTTLASSGAGYGFRGVAFAPVPEPSGIILAIVGMVALAWPLQKRIRRIA